MRQNFIGQSNAGNMVGHVNQLFQQKKKTLAELIENLNPSQIKKLFLCFFVNLYPKKKDQQNEFDRKTFRSFWPIRSILLSALNCNFNCLRLIG